MEITGFINELKKINGGNLLIAAIYDSEKKFLAVFEELSTDTPLKNRAVFKKIAGGGLIPVFLTKKHLTTSGDVFPAEVNEIKNSRVVYGQSELLNNLLIDKENLRLEAEQKFKGAMIRMNLLLLEKGMRPVYIRRIIMSAYEEIVTGLKALLGHKHNDIPFSFNTFSEKLNIKLDIISNLSPAALNKMKQKELFCFLNNFYALTELLANAADKAK